MNWLRAVSAVLLIIFWLFMFYLAARDWRKS